MNSTFDRKYVVVLSAVAGIVLFAGAALKPGKSAPEPPSPSQTAYLRATVRRAELADTGTYFAQRAESVAQDVFYDPEFDSSAVGWGTPGQVLVASHGDGSLAFPLALGTHQGSLPVVTRTSDQQAGRWLLIVGRTAEDKLLWSPATYGGARRATCGSEAYRELVVNTRLDAALAGAGAFDLDGALVGVVARCEDTFHVISVESVPALLQAFDSQQQLVSTLYGFRVAPLANSAVRLFSMDSGLLVAEITLNEAADRSGLRAGDVIVSAGAEKVSSEEDLARALNAGAQKPVALEVRRSGRKQMVTMPARQEVDTARAADASLGIRLLPPVRSSGSLFVAPKTMAYTGGLRTGDQLIQVGDNRNASASDLERAVSAPTAEQKPILVIYQRNRLQRAAVVSR